MAQNKTQPTTQNVEQFLNTIPDERRRKDSFTLLELMKQVTGLQPVMWGSSIVGFGTYRYHYASGRQGDWLVLGFSPRKQAITLYAADGFAAFEGPLAKLGKHSTGVGCLYIKRLDDVDLP